MAFEKDTNTRGNNSGRGDNDNWKSDAFINLYIPTNGGKRRKVGSIPLKNSKPFEADLISKLSTDPDAINRLLAMCELEFNLAEPDNESGFAAI
jgi:hypothetical protein